MSFIKTVLNITIHFTVTVMLEQGLLLYTTNNIQERWWKKEYKIELRVETTIIAPQ